MGEALMLINVVEEEEARVAVVENNRLEDFYLERASGDRVVGNIYKGRVINVEPSIEAAFLEFGYERHGFLHVSDVRPSPVGGTAGKNGRSANGPRPEKGIRNLVRPGDEFLVQVIKEGIGEKGPALTTYLSLPGRHLVLMPGMSLRGVSRRITDEQERRRLRDILKELHVPSDSGVIARTAAMGRDKRDIERDLDYLGRLWDAVKQRSETSKAPALVYQESDQVIRVIRDVFTEDIRNILVDSPQVYERVRAFLRDVMPHHVRKVKLYDGDQPLFHRYGVEEELAKMHSRTVQLPCGGSIVLQQTEALVAIDVNSGQFKGPRDAEESALQINLEAAEEVARQIRLRDMGGVIVIDFIDMQDKGRRAQVEKALWTALAKDKARFRMLKMSPFCLVELTRQRRRKSLSQTTYVECPTCKGTGHLRSTETIALDLIRKLRAGLQRPEVARVDVDAPTAVANYLNNIMRSRLRELESQTNKVIRVHADPARGPEDHEIAFSKSDGARVNI